MTTELIDELVNGLMLRWIIACVLIILIHRVIKVLRGWCGDVTYWWSDSKETRHKVGHNAVEVVIAAIVVLTVVGGVSQVIDRMRDVFVPRVTEIYASEEQVNIKLDTLDTKIDAIGTALSTATGDALKVIRKDQQTIVNNVNRHNAEIAAIKSENAARAMPEKQDKKGVWATVKGWLGSEKK